MRNYWIEFFAVEIQQFSNEVNSSELWLTWIGLSLSILGWHNPSIVLQLH
jgi:hypothetical protein